MAATVQGIFLSGDHASRPAASAPPVGSVYSCSDHNLVYQTDGSSWATWLTAGGGMSNPMTTAGDIIYGGASGTPTRRAIGTAGQVLTVNAGATAPEWAAASGGATNLESDKVVLTAGDLTTTNTTLTDATGLTITKTTGARRVLVGFYGSGYNTLATNHTCLAVNVDGTDKEEMIISQHSTASESMGFSFTYLTDVLSAASHTIKLRFRALSGGTATINATASFPAVFWIAELYAD